LKKWLVALVVSLAAALATGGALVAFQRQAESMPAERATAEFAGPPPQVVVSRVKEVNPLAGQRIVFAGDSSTDGNTYLLLIRQALAEAGRAVPGCINAGVSTDSMRGIRQRLERDVFVHRPTLVVVSAGTHDAIHKVPAADYEADVRAIAA